MKIPQIKPHFRVEIVEPKNVYLLSEYATYALTGGLYCQILPLLNGEHTREEIIQKLDGQVLPEHLDYVLDRLYEKGYLTDAAHSLTREAAAFWSLLGVDPQAVSDRLSDTKVFVTAIGGIDPQPLVESLEAIGLAVKEWQKDAPKPDGTSLLVVLTDDYLQPELSQINQTALQNQQPWLLIKPMGGMLWFGSIFHPGETGCWQCLAQRLNGNREVETSVLRQKKAQEKGCLPTAFAGLPSTVQTAIALTTTEIAKWLVKQIIPESKIQTLAGKIITLDQTNFTLKTHTVSQRPQCPACGNPDLISQQVNQAIALTSRKKLFTQDGGHRAFTPEQILQRYEHLISPITGVVSALVRVSDPNNPFVHTYSATHAFGTSTSLSKLRKSLGHKSGGKGKSDRQSQASGFCEAVERYSGIYQGDEPKINAKIADLDNSAIHPQECLLFSETQYQNREELNKKAIVDHDWIPKPFDAQQAIDWTPVWSLTEQRHKYLPTAFCYYDYKLPKEHRFCSADSNGNAAGGTLEDAILQGFLELVERDSVAIWWYNRLSRPSVDFASFNEPYLLDLQNWYRSQQRELWVLDLTTDLNIPAFAAVSRYIGGGDERIITGYGAHFDPKIAILRAVTEVNQIGFAVDQQDYSKASDSALYYWFTQATLANQPYLAPSTQQPAKLYADYPQQWSDDIEQDVLTCVEVARSAGLEMLVLNQTRPDIGLPVVKAIVPGLRHFWSRFGAGRLYDVPIKLGWLPMPLTEDQMNPMPMVF
ncbi:TOMM precursor leader peptide-binding protein [Argonema antarcticum]|uniref:TOMM precursor leader peptide-binding protein n=1 Tax=Argonema antarcticum TaxID=2942763 RepID=UPI0020127E4B|nr:TOMM precursor leader peptide-binding protein [Argonema antarcticum]MCL1469850.1 TOMM precursor leader peptide-binding protein [Argonema antarcticum A004/B2]